MCVEYAQLLSTSHRVLDGEMYVDKTANGRSIKRWRLPAFEQEIYKACHVNHPSAVWCRESIANYTWLYALWRNTAEEYTYRYGKSHACWVKLGAILDAPPENIPKGCFSEPPPAMKQFPQCIVQGDSVASYKNYYREAKASFAKWTNRQTPEFMQ